MRALEDVNLSKTLINALDKIMIGAEEPFDSPELCGEYVKRVIIRKEAKSESGPAAILGYFFEWLVTGNEPDDPKWRVPDFYSGKKTEENVSFWYDLEVPDLNSPDGLPDEVLKMRTILKAGHANAITQAAVARDHLKRSGFKNFESDVTITMKDEVTGANIKIIIDILCEDETGHPVIIDTKFTSLIDDKWSDYGWAYSSLHKKRNLLRQPEMYVYVFLKKTGILPDFYFYIADAKSSVKRRMYQIIVDDWIVEKMEGGRGKAGEIAFYWDSMVDMVTRDSFEPLPRPERCAKCPLFSEKMCTFATQFPPTNIIRIL